MKVFIAAFAAAVLSCGLAFSGAASAQVYKCQSSAGTVYSQQPCGANATEVRTRESRQPPASSNLPPVVDHRAAIQRSTAISSAGIRERNCLNAREADIYGPVRVRENASRQQISSLNASLSRANNNLAGATYASGIRGQIAALEQTIATDRAAAGAFMAQARQSCSEERQRTVDEINRAAETVPGN